ncbi:MAG TPA: ester cyclase [Roseiflexaceae bacterium]|nr:ester cyclase [Roseiflexaceae bacterium]
MTSKDRVPASPQGSASAMHPQNVIPDKERDQNKTTVRRILEAFNKGDPSIIDQLVHPSMRDHNPPPGVQPGLEGMKQQIKLLHTGFPDLRFEEDSLIAEGDMVFLRWKMTGTHTGPYFFGTAPTGKRVVHFGHELLRLKDGKIIEHRDMVDPLIFFDKLGLLDDKMLAQMSSVGLRVYDTEPYR